ncbi:MAG: hypothetical protein RL518_2171 [Pseudomonadota bacterium]
MAIIGAGFCGTLTAVHLARAISTKTPLDIYLIDRRGTFGPGLAYSPPSDRFKLNVRAKSMGAFPDDPEGFYHWLLKRDPNTSPDDFVSRRQYGEYLSHLLEEASAQSPEHTLHRIGDEVVDITPHGESGRWDITLKGGTTLQADACVVAIGNTMQRSPCATDTSRAFRDPFDSTSYSDLSTLKSIFILGSGLTAVDVIVEAEARGYTGTYTILSRHGRLPRSHEEPPSPANPQLPGDWDTQGSVRALVSTIRAESRRLGSSQPVFEAMRPKIRSMWEHLSLSERKRFLRHVRSIWDIHRHRIPHQHAMLLERLRTSGRIEVLAGRLAHCQQAGDRLHISLRLRGPLSSTIQRDFDTGFLCIGPDGDLTRAHNPLIQRLVAQQLAIPGPLQLGGTANTNATSLWLLGPMQRETHWEMTAVRELREEAARIARAVKTHLSAR